MRNIQVGVCEMSFKTLNPVIWVQGAYESRSIFQSLDIAWGLLRIFPRELLRRVTAKTLDQFYDREASK